MSIKYYDDAIADKISRWLPKEKNIRVLKPDESKRFLEISSEDKKEKPLTMPLFALSRSNDFTILSTIKTSKSFDGLILEKNERVSTQLNVIPISTTYQLDIYTKEYATGLNYVRELLFKLINNPKIVIGIPYNGVNIQHVANLRVLDTVSDTSDIAEHIFPGQFTRWSIQLELQDGFLFNVPYRDNWIIGGVDLEVSEKINIDGDIEPIIRFDEKETE